MISSRLKPALVRQAAGIRSLKSAINNRARPSKTRCCCCCPSLYRSFVSFASVTSKKKVTTDNKNNDQPHGGTTSSPPLSSSSSSLHMTPDSILDLPVHFLRTSDASNYDATTLQRNDVSFDLDNGKPILLPSASTTKQKPREHSPEILSSFLENGIYRITWKDGLVSEYTVDWVQEQLWRWKGGRPSNLTTTADANHAGRDGRVLWENLSEEDVRDSSTLSLPFDHVLTTATGQSRALRALYQYGILLVTQTPIHDGGAGVAALASALGGGSVKQEMMNQETDDHGDDTATANTSSSATTVLQHYLSGGSEVSLPRATDGPLRTLYGTVWSTTSSGQAAGASVADSAYGQDGLPLHTDMTYLRDPPGLQIFTMVATAAQGGGGASIFGDGLAAAERLRATCPTAFDVLSRTVRTYRCVDQATGWHLQASGPVIALDDHYYDDDDNNMTKKIVQIRHNDLDRLPDLPPVGTPEHAVDEFYQRLAHAHDAWDSILASDDIRLVVQLNPGDTIVVANQRCFHGRYSFVTEKDLPRSVMGCYVGQDELNSRFRMEGLLPHP